MAMAYIHERNFIHRDLKPANIMLTAGARRVKVADLGLAKLTAGIAAQQTICGTPAYLAPEVARQEAYDHRVDVYALGVIIMEMALREQPKAMHMQRERQAARMGSTPQHRPLAFVCRMLSTDMQRRGTMRDVLTAMQQLKAQLPPPPPAAGAPAAAAKQTELKERAETAARDAAEQRARARAEKQRAQQAEQENRRLKEENQRLRRALQQATEAKRGMEAQGRREQEAAARQVH